MVMIKGYLKEIGHQHFVNNAKSVTLVCKISTIVLSKNSFIIIIILLSIYLFIFFFKNEQKDVFVGQHNLTRFDSYKKKLFDLICCVCSTCSSFRVFFPL